MQCLQHTPVSALQNHSIELSYELFLAGAAMSPHKPLRSRHSVRTVTVWSVSVGECNKIRASQLHNAVRLKLLTNFSVPSWWCRLDSVFSLHSKSRCIKDLFLRKNEWLWDQWTTWHLSSRQHIACCTCKLYKVLVDRSCECHLKA